MTVKWFKLDNDYLISEEMANYPYYFIRFNKRKIVEYFEHDKDGYVRVRYYGRLVRLHRIIFKFYFGDIPKGYVIDHIDHVRDNNKIANLRCITQKENSQNQKRSKWFNMSKCDLIPLNNYKGHELSNYYIGQHGMYKSNTQKYRLLKDNRLIDVNGDKVRINNQDILNIMKLKRIFNKWADNEKRINI